MSKNPNDEAPARWVSRAVGGDGPEDRLAELVRAGAPPEGFAPAARDRVWARLGRRERHAHPLASLRWSVVVGIVLASGAVVGAASAPRWWPRLTAPRLQPQPATDGAKATGRARRQVKVAETAPVAQAATPEIQTAPVEVAAPVPAARRVVALNTRRPPEPLDVVPPAAVVPPDIEPAPLPAAAAPAPSALANEAALLGVALARLRQQRDAVGALAALDEYDARAPRGTLRREADGARVDALLMLGRDADALAVLRGLTLQPRGRDLELRVVRGELAASSDCASAVGDFDRALAQDPPPALAERALHGRATCLAKLGDDAAALRDQREYLRRFPDGRFAAEARRLSGENDL